MLEKPQAKEPPRKITKLLLVEDNEFQRTTITHILKQFPVQYDQAEDGEKAIHIFNRFAEEKITYSIILMDIFMPIMNGIDSVKNIRKIEQKLKLPPAYICGLSSERSDDLESKCINSGMNIFLQKPVTSTSIGKVISQFL